MLTRILVVLVICLAATAVLAAPADEEVILVQVTHRHGARTPIVHDPALAASICGPAGCGQLTHNGKMMLEALGIFLSDRYGKNDAASYFAAGSPTPAAPSSRFSVFADSRYHMRQLETRSTDIDRTIQSADSVIRGITNNNMSDYFPVIHTVNQNRDTLILTDTALSMVIPFLQKKNECINKISVSSFKTRYPLLTAKSTSKKTPTALFALQDMAEELNMAGNLPCGALTYSSSIYDWMNCTLNLQDATASFMSMYSDATTTRFPLATKAFDELSDFLQMIRVCKYATTSKEQGFLSYKLVEKQAVDMTVFAQAWVAETKDKIAGSIPAHATLMFEYSGHDTTIAPLAAALGHPELLLPLFGQTIVTELVCDKEKLKTSSDPINDGTFTIRHWYGSPKVLSPPADGSVSTPAHYKYEFESLSVVCANTTTSYTDKKSVKNVTDGSCSLGAFSKYAQQVLKPTEAAGAACYLDDDMRKNIHCATAPAPAAGSLCQQFREWCPKYGCPNHFVVDTRTLRCVPLQFLSAVSVGQAWALGSGTLVSGALMGVALAFIVRALRMPESKN